MSLKIPPNTRISVDSMAREFGISQTPIREALSMLEANGLVTKQRFIGYCTAPTLNRKQFEELFEIRLLMEPYAARCAAERMSDKAVDRPVRTGARDESRSSRAVAQPLRPVRRPGRRIS